MKAVTSGGDISTRVGARAALVTGASRGIGRAVAAELAAQEMAVALLARSQGELDAGVAEIRASGGAAVAVAADVTDPTAVGDAVRRVALELGPIELLVNNAGSAAAIGPLWEVNPDDWWRDVETNVRGAFLVSRAVLPGMVERTSGRIVNIASSVGIRPSPHLSGYGAAKAALINLTESLAAEVREHGISVFTVHPGHVRTDLVQKFIESHEGRRWLPHVPQSEPVEAALAARLICRLASGQADGLSGRFLHVLDDLDDLIARAEEVQRDDLYAPRLRR